MGERKGNQSYKGFWYVSRDHLGTASMEIPTGLRATEGAKGQEKNGGHQDSQDFIEPPCSKDYFLGHPKYNPQKSYNSEAKKY